MTKFNGKKILEKFDKCFKEGGKVSQKMPDGSYIYAVGGPGGVLCKLVGDKMFVCIDKKWVEVEDENHKPI